MAEDKNLCRYTCEKKDIILETLIQKYCLRPPRLLDGDLPLIGKIKVEPEDFVVREIGGVRHSQSGEHLHCWIEKRDLGTEQLLSALSKHLRISSEQIGLAGMKDKRAVTYQWISVPAKASDRLADIELAGFSLLKAVRHDSKLRRGQLDGNAFEIQIRGAVTQNPAKLEQRFNRIATQGIPNYFGPQRFGHGAENVNRGLSLLKKEKIEKNQFLRGLYLHSVQSAVFNHLVGTRVEEGLFDRVLRGDVLQSRKTHLRSICMSTEVGQERLDQGIADIVGPLLGYKCPPAKAVAASRELASLQKFGLEMEAFKSVAGLLPGLRRPIRVVPTHCSLGAAEGGWRVSFRLPPGSYATVVLRELMEEG